MAESKKKPASVARLLRRIAGLEGDVEALRQQSAALVRTNESTAAESAAHKRTAEVAAKDAARWRDIVSKVMDVFYPSDNLIRSRGRDVLEGALPETVRFLSQDADALRGENRDLRAFRVRAENALRRARALIDDGDHRIRLGAIAEIDDALNPSATNL